MTRLPAGWREVTLDELQADEPRAITDGPFGSSLTSAHYTSEGPRVVRLQNIGDGRFVDAQAHISQSHFEALRAHEVLPGDLLIASLGQDPPRACLAPESLGPAIVKADCIRIRLGPAVDPRWVLYVMQTPQVKRWAAERMYGVGRPRLGLKTIRAIPVPLASIAEQRRTLEILEGHLSRLDAAMNGLVRSGLRLATWERTCLDRAVHGAASGETTLRALVQRVEAGRSFGGSSKPALPDEWGIIKVSAMTWGTFRPEENKAVPPGQVNTKYEIRDGDVLVSRANTTDYVGASVYVESTRRQLLLSDKSLRLVPRPGVDPRWLHAVLSSIKSRRQVSMLATGTKDSMRNISQDSLLSIAVPTATIGQQAQVLEARLAIEQRASRMRTGVVVARRRSEALRHSLLIAAFSGQLAESKNDREPIEVLAGV